MAKPVRFEMLATGHRFKLYTEIITQFGNYFHCMA